MINSESVESVISTCGVPVDRNKNVTHFEFTFLTSVHACDDVGMKQTKWKYTFYWNDQPKHSRIDSESVHNSFPPNFFSYLPIHPVDFEHLDAGRQGHHTINTSLTHVESAVRSSADTSERDYIIMGCIQLIIMPISEGNIMSVHGISIHSAGSYKK